jgi:hypothetical protein
MIVMRMIFLHSYLGMLLELAAGSPGGVSRARQPMPAPTSNDRRWSMFLRARNLFEKVTNLRPLATLAMRNFNSTGLRRCRMKSIGYGL